MSQGFCVFHRPCSSLPVVGPHSFFLWAFSLGMASRGLEGIFPRRAGGWHGHSESGENLPLSHRCPCLAQGNLDTFCFDIGSPQEAGVLQVSDQSLEWPFTPLQDLRLSLTKGSLTSSPTCVNLGSFLTARVSAVCLWTGVSIRNTDTRGYINFTDNFTWGSDEISSRLTPSPMPFVTVRLCCLESQGA